MLHHRVLNFPQQLLLYILKKKDNKQKFIHMEMLDGSLLFEKHTTKWTKNTRKCSKQRENQTEHQNICVKYQDNAVGFSRY